MLLKYDTYLYMCSGLTPTCSRVDIHTGTHRSCWRKCRSSCVCSVYTRWCLTRNVHLSVILPIWHSDTYLGTVLPCLIGDNYCFDKGSLQKNKLLIWYIAYVNNRVNSTWIVNFKDRFVIILYCIKHRGCMEEHEVTTLVVRQASLLHCHGKVQS